MLNKITESSTFIRFREYAIKHERHVGAASIVLGFIWDSLTLTRPDQLLGNITLAAYLLGSAGGILILAIYARKSGVVPVFWLAIVQFAFGNLAGGLIVVYGRSGTFEGSFLFFLILAAFVIGNEFLRGKYSRINFHVSVWYFLLLPYLVLVVPMVLGKMGDGVFLLSGAVSLIIVTLFLFVLHAVSSRITIDAIRKTALLIGAIFAVFNGLYFLNFIPPVPLSLRGIGIYHSLERSPGGGYKVTYEKPPWYDFWNDTSDKLSIIPGDKADCFSSVFAPVGLSTGINHHWEYYDERVGEWKTSSIFPFSITGGRDNGYRGYSEKSSISLGKWRCSVETTSGALIGRMTFDVVYSATPPVLSKKEM